MLRDIMQIHKEKILAQSNNFFFFEEEKPEITK